MGALHACSCASWRTTASLTSAWLSGPGARRDVARARRQRAFRGPPASTPTVRSSTRAFRPAASAPAAAAGLFDERTTPLWRLPVIGDGCARHGRTLGRASTTPRRRAAGHDFTDPGARHALPRRPLPGPLRRRARSAMRCCRRPSSSSRSSSTARSSPPWQSSGCAELKLIDPTCGCGHFLIGAFERLFAAGRTREPGVPAPELARPRTASGPRRRPQPVRSRDRPLPAHRRRAQACGIQSHSPTRPAGIRIACGDSLLHGPRELQRQRRVRRSRGSSARASTTISSPRTPAC